MTNKPMLSVERKVIEDILADAREPGTHYMAARKVLRALLDKPVEVTSEDVLRWMDEHAAAQHQGEPVAEVERAEGDLPHVQLYQDLPDGTKLYAEQPAPVAVVMPFAEKVIGKLQRFEECASDGQGADIGSHWFEVLTRLSLLNRVQRSPAIWEITAQGEDVLEVARLNGVKP